MILKTKLLLFIIFVSFSLKIVAQEIPLVYSVENTGDKCKKPVLPSIKDLPVIQPLTDPFQWSDASGRDTTFAGWTCRRAEIKAEIEHYEIGPKPKRPNDITASYKDGLLTVNIKENGNTLTLTSKIILPQGNGPFPAVIGMGGNTGSLPSKLFTSRNIALIPFNFGQVMAHSQTRGKEPINKLYPDLTYMGAYSAWPWGVSRLIDGLELVQKDLKIDLKHLAVTGCSFAGKMALFVGAFDERIALTIAQEPGGGGAAAWRVSETLGDVEKLGKTSRAWFMESMFQFSGNNVSKLPHDHHELMAMVAPRALLVLGNPDYGWLAEESGYVSCRAAHRVWKTFGIPDRFGFSIVGRHRHCALPESQYPEVEAFVKKFLLNDKAAKTDVTIHPYDDVNYEKWTHWWGTNDASFPPIDTKGAKIVTLEAECGTVGSDWEKIKDNNASNGYFVTAKPGKQSSDAAPVSSQSHVNLSFSIDSSATYTLFARLNCPSHDDDSYWIKMDNGDFSMYNGLANSGWKWMKLNDFMLEKGKHTITIGYREDGAKLDKLSFSTHKYVPEGLGINAKNCQTTRIGSTINQDGYRLSQNNPNLIKGNKTFISFNIPQKTYVSLKIFNMIGVEIKELAGKEFNSGNHTLEVNVKELGQGCYFYIFNTNQFNVAKKMIINSK